MNKARIEKWIEDAKREAIRVCEGGAARRCIPRQDTDTDALLGDGARMMVDVLAHIEALEAENAKLRRRRKVIGLEQVDLADFDTLTDPYDDED